MTNGSATLGEKLREIRKDRKMTQLRLAERAGLDNGTISRLELGKARSIGRDALTRVEETLDVPVGFLRSHGMPKKRARRAVGLQFKTKLESKDKIISRLKEVIADLVMERGI